jgi:putative transposase
LTDVQAGVRIKKLLPRYEIAEIKSLSREQRDEILRNIKQIEGVSLRQAARILVIPLTLVFKA